MKTFEDLKFQVRKGFGKQATMNFENDYGVSALLGSAFYSNGVDTYEIGILYKDGLTYDTDITEDILGYQTQTEVTEIMKRVQELK